GRRPCRRTDPRSSIVSSRSNGDTTPRTPSGSTTTSRRTSATAPGRGTDGHPARSTAPVTIVAMTDPVLPVAAPAGDPLSAGLAALDRPAWAEASDLLSAADREGVLSGSDLEHLTEPALFAGQPVRAMDSKERSFRAYNDAGDEIRAGYLATQIARDYAMSGKSSIASAWGGR